MEKVKFTDEVFLRTLEDVMFELNDFKVDDDEGDFLEVFTKEILEEIGRCLGRNKSKDKPFGFKVYDDVRDIIYLSAKVTYREPEGEKDKGNFGIDISKDSNLPDFTKTDFLEELLSKIRRKYSYSTENLVQLRDFVIGVCAGIFTFLIENCPEDDGEFLTLEFDDLLDAKVGWKKGKKAIKYTAGSEIKKKIKSDLQLVSD